MANTVISGHAVLLRVRLDLDERHVVEHHLVLFNGTFVEYRRLHVLGRDINPLPNRESGVWSRSFVAPRIATFLPEAYFFGGHSSIWKRQLGWP